MYPASSSEIAKHHAGNYLRQCNMLSYSFAKVARQQPSFHGSSGTVRRGQLSSLQAGEITVMKQTSNEYFVRMFINFSYFPYSTAS
jgi:hypothetical protein